MSTISSGTTSTTTLVHSGDTTGSLVFKTNDTGSGGTTAMTIDTSQNVGIGTTSPAAKFHSAGGIIATGSASAFTATAGIMDTSGGNARITATGADSSTYGVLTFNRGSSNASLFQEAMRIDSSGNLLVGTTSLAINERLNVTAGNTTGCIFKNTGGASYSPLYVWNATTTGDGYFSAFFTETTASIRGSITYNRGGGVVAYNTTSDYRLKENIVDLPNALATVAQLKPRQFDWKETGNTTTGFIAHELAEVCPHAVTGEKDAVDEEGNPKYQGVDTSFLVATLTAAIQELKAINDQQAELISQLQADVKALKGNN